MRLVNRRITLAREEAMHEAHPEACWIAHLKDTVKELNDTDYHRKVTAGMVYFRIVATHTPAEDTHATPGENERRILSQTTKKGGPPTHIDLAIGSRVSCVQNLGTQIGEKTKLHGSISYQIIQTILHLRYLLGIYNGAKGTVVGFAFRGCTPTITTPLHATFHTMEPREIPTVFVKMDNPIGYTIQEGPQDIIPFVAVCRQEDKYHKKYHRW